MNHSQRVLAAVDFSPGSRRALGEAVRICKTFDRRLHVTHVIEGRVVENLAELLQWPLAEASRRALDKTRETLAQWVAENAGPPDTRLHLAIGAPVPEILSCVDLVEPQLLVLGESGLSRRWTGLAALAANDPERPSVRVLMIPEGTAPADTAGAPLSDQPATG